jgi:hypothetical protein
MKLGISSINPNNPCIKQETWKSKRNHTPSKPVQSSLYHHGIEKGSHKRHQGKKGEGKTRKLKPKTPIEQTKEEKA